MRPRQHWCQKITVLYCFFLMYDAECSWISLFAMHCLIFLTLWSSVVVACCYAARGMA